jgi:TolB-like protein/Flp pilus assembly protein TadD
MQFLEELKKRNVIRVAALYIVASWLILQVGDLIFDAFDVPSWSTRLLIAILILGFPIVLALSWAFELTSDGLVREQEIGRGVARRLSGRRANILIVAMVVLTVALVVADQMRPHTGPDHRSIAVLPFLNISDDPANDYFSDGLSEELLNLLARIPELQVTARTSSFSFKDKDLDLPTIGRLLHVAHVLEGSVRKSGQQIRITAQLIDVESGFHVWSQNYDRDMDDIFVIQDEISAAVVAALRVSILGDAPRARGTDPEAFTAYLNASHFYQQRTNDSYNKAVSYAQQAIDIDPDYAPAWNLLSATYSNLAISRQLPYDEAHEKALLANERALGIDPNFALALSARAWLAMNHEYDFASAAVFFRRALDIEPNNPVILSNRAVLASRLRRTDEAIELSRKSLALDPITSVGYSNLSDFLARAGRPFEAIEVARKAVELAPGNEIARANLAIFYLLAEQADESVAELERFERDIYRFLIGALAFPAVDRAAESDAALAQLIEQYADSGAYYVAAVYAWRNDRDAAFEWLERAVSEGQSTNGIGNEPLLRNLHDDARWNPLLERLGLSDEQVAAIRF